MRYIFMLSGWSASGKDLVADYLGKLQGIANPHSAIVQTAKFKSFHKLAVANELKLLVANKYNIDHKLTLTQAGKKTYIDIPIIGRKTVRELLIEEGALQKQRMGPSVFIAHLADKITHMDYIAKLETPLTNPQNIVISDFRFIHEYEYLYNMFETYEPHDQTRVITIRINRFDSQDSTDESETQLDNFRFDYIIENKEDIPALYKKVDNLLHLLHLV